MRFGRPSSGSQASSTVGRSSSRKRHGGLHRAKPWKYLWRTTPRSDGHAFKRRMHRGSLLGIILQSSVLSGNRSRCWTMLTRRLRKLDWTPTHFSAGHARREHSMPSVFMMARLARAMLRCPGRAPPKCLSSRPVDRGRRPSRLKLSSASRDRQRRQLGLPRCRPACEASRIARRLKA